MCYKGNLDVKNISGFGNMSDIRVIRVAGNLRVVRVTGILEISVI